MTNDPASDLGMTLRPSRIKAFLISFGVFGTIITATLVALVWLVDSRLPWPGLFVPLAFLVAAFSLFFAIFFTPAELSFDVSGIRIEAPFPRPADYRWAQLEFYTPVMNAGLGMQRFKFEDLNMPYQIASAGFNRREWKAFQQFLRERFPEKRKSLLQAMLHRRN